MYHVCIFWSFVALQTPRGWNQPHFGWDAVRLMASWLSLESDFGGCARTVLEWQSKYGTAGGSGRKVCFLSECALRNGGVHRHPHVHCVKVGRNHISKAPKVHDTQ